MLRQSVTLLLAAAFVATFVVFSTAFAAEKSWDEQRRDVVQSKQYQKRCKNLNKLFPIVQSEAALAGREPKLLCRIPPVYEEACIKNAAPLKIVVLVYDVSPEGLTENIRLKSTDDECVVRAAAASLALWSYEPTEYGAANLETSITFELQ